MKKNKAHSNLVSVTGGIVFAAVFALSLGIQTRMTKRSAAFGGARGLASVGVPSQGDEIQDRWAIDDENDCDDCTDKKRASLEKMHRTALELYSLAFRPADAADAENKVRATRLLLQACREGSAKACADFVNYVEQKNTDLMRESIALFHERCESGSAKSCQDLGLLRHRAGEPVSASSAAFIRSCDLNPKYGCVMASLDLKDDGQVEAAANYAFRACRANSANCALTLRHFASDPRAMETAALVEKECRESKGMGASACTVVASWHMKRGDKDKAFDLLQLDCERENRTSCALAIGFQLKSGDHKAALAAFQAFCDRAASLQSDSQSDFMAFSCDSRKKGRLTSEQHEYALNLAQSFSRE